VDAFVAHVTRRFKDLALLIERHEKAIVWGL
jgi:hypothetical protein